MGFWKKLTKDVAKTTGIVLGDVDSANARNATKAAVDGMDLFRQKMNSSIIQNGQFSAQKGNLFEYIEAAKFNTDAASKGVAARAFVTDALGDSQATADILIRDKGRTAKQIQAKFIQSFSNGRDTSASRSVREQTGADNKGWGQYDGMDRLIRKQENYSKDGSLLDAAKKLSKQRAESGSIYSEYYDDVNKHLTDETRYQNVTSGGTTIEEVRNAYERPEQYSRQFERKMVRTEMKNSAGNMAKASMVTTGLVSGITNMFEVFTDDKELTDALIDVSKDVGVSAARGAATGVISTEIRYQGIKRGSAILSDSTAATILAGGMIDGGVALYSYAKGELTAEQLKEQLVETTAKSVSTVYFTKAVEAALGASNPFLPIAMYTTASYVVTCTKEIMKEAELNEQEYYRLEAVHKEAYDMLRQYHSELENNIESYKLKQRTAMYTFLNKFDYNMQTGENYDEALMAIVNFANETGIALQHVNFNDFRNAMKSDDDFELK